MEREVRVLVDRARAGLYGLTVADVAERVRRQNQNLPAGTFEDEFGEATLRAIGDYESIEQILDTVVREDGSGTRVRVRDVARVERGLEKPIFITRYNGQDAAIVSVAFVNLAIRPESGMATNPTINKPSKPTPTDIRMIFPSILRIGARARSPRTC